LSHGVSLGLFTSPVFWAVSSRNRASCICRAQQLNLSLVAGPQSSTSSCSGRGSVEGKGSEGLPALQRCYRTLMEVRHVGSVQGTGQPLEKMP
jgi:hypothetical protein